MTHLEAFGFFILSMKLALLLFWLSLLLER
jgi:hypothetical protein